MAIIIFSSTINQYFFVYFTSRCTYVGKPQKQFTSGYAQKISMFSLKILAGFEPGSSVPQADAMTTAQAHLLGPYSETCSNLRRSKLLQKSSVSKFVCSVAKGFFINQILSLVQNIAYVIFDIEIQYMRAKTNKKYF
jgi:hypothetical protein